MNIFTINKTRKGYDMIHSINLRKIRQISSIFGTGLFIILILVSSPKQTSELNQNLGTESSESNLTPNPSAGWQNTSIIIDTTMTTNTSHSGNWTWAIAQDWCHGEGTIGSPYVIEDITFNIPDGQSGLSIMNSKGKYFTIKECTFANVSSTNQQGLYLFNTDNGTITNCNFIDNWRSIYLTSSSCYNSLTHNYVYNSSLNAIGIRSGSNYNNISFNDIDLIRSTNWEFGAGIYVRASAFNQIRNNNCSAANNGIILYQGNNNTIQYNNGTQFRNMGIKCYISSQSNIISSNYFSGEGRGIEISSGANNFNTISFNFFENCSGLGLYLGSASNCFVYNNTITNSLDPFGFGALSLYTSSNYNQIYNNSIYGGFMRINQGSNNYIEDNYIENVENDGYGIYFSSSSSNNQISNNKIIGGNKGLYAGTLTNTKIVNNQFIGCRQEGVYISNPTNVSIISNLITGVNTGLNVRGSGLNNSFVDNNVSDCIEYGLKMQETVNWTIENNYFNKGWLLLDCTSENIDNSNLLGEKSIKYYYNHMYLDLDGDVLTDVAQLFVDHCSEVTIRNFHFADVPMGIGVVESKQISILDNVLSSNADYGIYLHNLNDSMVSNNQIHDSMYGISNLARWHDDFDEDFPDYALLYHNVSFYQNTLENCEIALKMGNQFESQILENSILNTSESGIYLEYCYNSTISTNCIDQIGEYGIFVSYCPNSSFTVNEINNVEDSGIFLECSSENYLFENSIKSAQIGIELSESHNSSLLKNYFFNNTDFGISSSENENITINQNEFVKTNGTGIALASDSMYWIIWENIFVNNEVHAQDDGSSNFWYRNGIGNYWDNYTGLDADFNGIGDKPYNISGSAAAQDLYPIVDEVKPILSSDQSTYYTTGLILCSISWNAIETYPDVYWIISNNTTVVEETPWNTEIITYNILPLSLTNGSYQYTLWVRDLSGNEKSDNVSVIVDSVAPIISNYETQILTSQVDNYMIYYNLSDANPNAIVISLDGVVIDSSLWGNGTAGIGFSQTYFLDDDPSTDDSPDGTYLVTIFVNDTVGNSNTVNISLIIDTSAPSFDVPSLIIADAESETISLNWTISDQNPGNYSIWFNNTQLISDQPWLSGLVTYDLDINGLEPGNYTLEIRVRDSLGNEHIEKYIIQIPEPSSNTGLIIGLIGGGLVLIGTGAGVFIFLKKKKQG
ncbi:right-handed parallel beta-helix repeat-containing protein [Candidatus Lokiarchaeum ossiferum]|uniref:right-handed parallel beta-helix repeat-containing protein n=1 Tax=Candidatus Lokiarchaeum ossiferum TaxID=2951803 RepID=UPI00352CA232